MADTREILAMRVSVGYLYLLTGFPMGVTSTLQKETVALLHGLRLAGERNLDKIECQTDSAELLRQVGGTAPPFQSYRSYLHQIKVLMQFGR
ncbi:hypothetical protein TanjilG_18178 [Lupinus angustifolius]|uniref:RNase H type-1 domain-containing protein n=1 Tax=Lupinus angustifolius TaxID=3871 RepID=A0A1J7IAP5_LUPAN|nr:hypothetical protein TanjilG_18178 [Lupinus angustifolius]